MEICPSCSLCHGQKLQYKLGPKYTVTSSTGMLNNRNLYTILQPSDMIKHRSINQFYDALRSGAFCHATDALMHSDRQYLAGS